MTHHCYTGYQDLQTNNKETPSSQTVKPRLQTAARKVFIFPPIYVSSLPLLYLPSLPCIFPPIIRSSLPSLYLPIHYYIFPSPRYCIFPSIISFFPFVLPSLLKPLHFLLIINPPFVAYHPIIVLPSFPFHSILSIH